MGSHEAGIRYWQEQLGIFSRLLYGMRYGAKAAMEARQKITVHVPADLLATAQEATGQGITATVRRGLRMVATRTAYQRLRGLRGTVSFSIDLGRLREDRG